jgi:predicted kinase
MEMVLFIGIQASGKSSFYRERFFRTHVRVNLDMLKTRHREQLLINACLAGQTKFVVENTNVTRKERARHIIPARNAGFRIIGYFFETTTAEAVQRNESRPEPDRVPKVAIFTAMKRLEPPNLEEGFDELFRVRLNTPAGFIVEPWRGGPSIVQVSSSP